MYLMQSMTASVGPLVLPTGQAAVDFTVKLMVFIRDKYGSYAKVEIEAKVGDLKCDNHIEPFHC
jgi:hypothetical protein